MTTQPPPDCNCSYAPTYHTPPEPRCPLYPAGLDTAAVRLLAAAVLATALGSVFADLG